MLCGVTLITHGYQPLSSERPAWVTQMASAVAARAGDGVSIYNLRIAREGGTARVTSFNLVFGPGPSSPSSRNAETVVMLDWSDASGLLFSSFSTATIAGLVKPYLTSTVPSAGISTPLASGPIHLIGHSRGGSLVAALANDLGREGIWVDQLTTIDPYPVASVNDFPAVLTDRVRYADNYYETLRGDTAIGVIAGAPVEGALNVNLDPIGANHTTTHTWYHGTISTQASSVVSESIGSGWYTPVGLGPRGTVGFNRSRLGGLAVDTGGIGAPFGGTGRREPVAGTGGSKWPNIGGVRVTNGTAFQIGQAIRTSFEFEDADSDASIAIYLDTDRNPSGGAFKVAESNQAGEPGVFDLELELNTAGVAAGSYFVLAAISDGTRIRYDYWDTPVTLTAPPPEPVYGYDLAASLYFAPFSVSPAIKSNIAGLAITNAGNLRYSGGVDVDLWASQDDTLDAADFYVSTSKQRLSLRPGATRYINLRFAAPSGVPDGSYRLIALIDAGQQSSELSFDNNTSTASGFTTFVAPFVDVGVSLWSAPTSLRTGKRGMVTLRLTNNGNVTASGFHSLGVFLSQDKAGTTPTQVGSVGRNLRIKPGSSVLVRIPVTAFMAGFRYLSATVEFMGSPGDRSGQNNTVFSSTAISIG